MAEHSALAGALPWYAAGTLDGDARAEIERHLSTCAACRDRLEQIRLFAEIGAAAPIESALEHVAPGLLVDYVERPDSLDHDTRSWIEGRLATCAVCRDACANLRQVGTALAQAPQSAPRAERGAARPGLWDWLAATFLRPVPALAYLLIAAIGLPLVWTLRTLDDEGSAVQVLSISGEHTQRTEPGEGSQPLPTLTLDDASRPVLIELTTELTVDDLHSGGMEFVVELTSGRDTVWSERRSPESFHVRDGKGLLPVVLDPGRLDLHRTYRLAIRVEKPGDPLDGQALFVRQFRFAVR